MTLQEYEVKRLDPFSTGKIAAAFSGLLGLLTGLIYLPIVSFLMSGGFELSTSMLIPLLSSITVGVLLVLVLTSAYIGVGFFLGVIYGYVYNYMSSRIGGLEMVMDVEG